MLLVLSPLPVATAAPKMHARPVFVLCGCCGNLDRAYTEAADDPEPRACRSLAPCQSCLTRHTH